MTDWYMQPGDYDYPPATVTPDDMTNVPNRLQRLRRALQRTREQVREVSEHSDHYGNWLPPPSRMRRRRYRDPEQSPPRFSRRPSATEPSSDVDDIRQRSAKRRKLTHSETTFRYGHYGQVEAGRLRLVLESCDGEVHNEDRSLIDFGPENILKHDKSVYCSRASKCNIVLRHHDDSTFCLEKLYIIAPENGFTAP